MGAVKKYYKELQEYNFYFSIETLLDFTKNKI